MISIFKADGTRLGIAYNGLTLNNPADADNDRFEVNTVTTADAYSAAIEEEPADDGVESYLVRKTMRSVRIEGILRAPTLARLYDRQKALFAAFDPSKVSHENQSVNGFLALDFSTPTTDTTNYATGLVPSRYYARCAKSLPPPDSQFTGFSVPFVIDLLIADPRRYWQTASTQSGAGTIDNSLADYRSWPTLTITMSGAGNAAYTYQNASTIGGTKSIVLNLSTMVNADIVVVDMKTKKITKNGVETPSLYVSGSFFEVEPGSNVITITNGTNAASVLGWRRAFCA
jgi:hypothetical protein